MDNRFHSLSKITDHCLVGKVCCALCFGVIDWHNCGMVFGHVRVVGIVCTLFPILCIIIGIGPSILVVVMNPRLGNVATGICSVLLLTNVIFSLGLSPYLFLPKSGAKVALFSRPQHLVFGIHATPLVAFLDYNRPGRREKDELGARWIAQWTRKLTSE